MCRGGADEHLASHRTAPPLRRSASCDAWGLLEWGYARLVACGTFEFALEPLS
jgi:hypothetical protein